MMMISVSAIGSQSEMNECWWFSACHADGSCHMAYAYHQAQQLRYHASTYSTSKTCVKSSVVIIIVPLSKGSMFAHLLSQPAVHDCLCRTL